MYGRLRKLLRRSAPALGLLVSCLASSAIANIPPDAVEIGAARLVVPAVSGQIGPVTRELERDGQVYADEVISTTDGGATRIVFLDDTELTIGANSTVVLDQYIYDPNQGTGTMVVNMLNGVFDFKSGSLPSESYQLNTPSATLAIRGTGIRFVVEQIGENQFKLTFFVTSGTVTVTYFNPDGSVASVTVSEGEGISIDTEYRTLADGSVEAVVIGAGLATCSGVACSEGVFAAAQGSLATDMDLNIAQAEIDPGAGFTTQTATGGSLDLGSLLQQIGDSVSDF